MEEVISRHQDYRLAIVGNGYIGKALAQHLLSNGVKSDSLQIITRNNYLSLENTAYDVVFYCAGLTGDYRKDIPNTIDSNITFLSRILERFSVSKNFVLLSSTRVYGFSKYLKTSFDETNLLSERDHLNLENFYDQVKIMQESICYNYPGLAGLAILRLSNVYGGFTKEALDDTTFLKYMIRVSMDGGKIEMTQSPDSTKDYIFISDAVEGIVRAGFLNKGKNVFNIASGTSSPVSEWIKKLKIELTVKNDPVPIHSAVSISKAKDLLGFVPKYSVENTDIRQIIL